MYIILCVILLKRMSPFPIEALYACSAASSSCDAGGLRLGRVCEALKQMHHWQEPALLPCPMPDMSPGRQECLELHAGGWVIVEGLQARMSQQRAVWHHH